MKTYIKFSAIVLSMLLFSCVQESFDRTIIFKLKTDEMKEIKSAGIRGGDKPLNWEYDHLMVFDPSDSCFKATIKMHTGYLFTEFKFTVNGEFELKDMPNRKIFFGNHDTIIYSAEFNKPKNN